MINTAGLILDAWYDLLSGSISVDVFKEDAPSDQEANYVVISVESGTASNNKSNFSDEVVVITDIVTMFGNNVDRSVAEGIDGEINALVLPTRQTGLTNPSGVQILNVKRDTFSYLIEADSSKKYYRKISRYTHTLFQQ